MDKKWDACSPQCEAWLRLRHCNRLPPSVALRLVKALGGPEVVFDAPADMLRAVLGNHSYSRKALDEYDEQGFQRDMQWAEQCDRHHIISWVDGRYPALLREISDPPLLLYVNGDPNHLESIQLAIVGSRNPTPGGHNMAFRFASNLADAGFTITSGLAIGIDGAAHKGALSTQGHTIAVMATGLDRIYPSRHRHLALAIRDNGALVSEMPIGTPPTKQSFPRRNRIISGLSVGTLVVEATRRSGSLITARLAGEQGREVYAIPGSILSPQSRGCHALIRDGARLVETEADIFSELGHLGPDATRTPQSPGSGRTVTLLDSMGYDPVAIDTLVERSGLTAGKVSSMLLRLELQGVVKTVTGGHYVRIE